jgi:putative SOS response-associated peptidase YedK
VGPSPLLVQAEQVAKPAYSTINARDDRIQAAATYRDSFKKRRCLVPATGWYEWQKIDAKTKQPFHFQPAAKSFALAGIYDTWKGRDGLSDITSFSVVTTSPAPSTAVYHDRMPVVLEESQFEDWMRLPPETAAEMMKPHDGAIDVWAVPKEVGNVRNTGPS